MTNTDETVLEKILKECRPAKAPANPIIIHLVQDYSKLTPELLGRMGGRFISFNKTASEKEEQNGLHKEDVKEAEVHTGPWYNCPHCGVDIEVRKTDREVVRCLCCRGWVKLKHKNNPVALAFYAEDVSEEAKQVINDIMRDLLRGLRDAR